MIFPTPPMSFEEAAALGKIDELRRQLRFSVSQPRRWVGQVRRVLGARAIQGSNSIEGYSVSVEDALAAIGGEEPTDAQTEDWNAVSGYRRAMTYVLQLAQDEHFAYTPQLIRSLHFMMTEYTLEASPGLWRPGPIWIRNDATGDIVYEGPPHDEVPELIEELVAHLSVEDETPVLLRAAMAHLNLVMIHPFRDGNGRMSRCLQTLVLARDQILEPQFSSIEEYLGRNTQSYYQVLRRVGGENWNPQGDARPWVRYCLEAHFIQASSVLRRVQESGEIWERLETLCTAKRLPFRMLSALFDATVGLQVRNASYRTSLKMWDEEISNQSATDDLRAMVQAGLLQRFGARRGTFYQAAAPLQQIGMDVRKNRRAIDAGSLFAITD
ncbi:MAG TPA: Fic family protein [Solirubrobacteraceae bacterium]|jgi:Fic family protein